MAGRSAVRVDRRPTARRASAPALAWFLAGPEAPQVSPLSRSNADRAFAHSLRQVFGALPAEQERLVDLMGGEEPSVGLFSNHSPSDDRIVREDLGRLIGILGKGERLPPRLRMGSVGFTAIPGAISERGVQSPRGLAELDLHDAPGVVSSALAPPPENVLLREQLQAKKGTSPKRVATVESAPTLPSVPSLDEASFRSALAKFREESLAEMAQYQARVEPLVHAYLTAVKGQVIESAAERKEFVADLGAFLNRTLHRVKCSEHGTPSLLGVAGKGQGFFYRHTDAVRSMCATGEGDGAVVPHMVAIPWRPPRS